jgi:hypothetical protein
MIPRFMVAALCVLGPLTCVAHAGNINGEATYVSFSVPGALGTYPMSINSSQTVTGYYNVSATGARGFLREADGSVTTFNVGGAIWTEPEGINADGDIAGFYELVAGTPRGFLRYADGRIITFDPPPPVEGMPLQSQPTSISDFDDIAGTYLYAWVNFRHNQIPPATGGFYPVTGGGVQHHSAHQHFWSGIQFAPGHSHQLERGRRGILYRRRAD